MKIETKFNLGQMVNVDVYKDFCISQISCRIIRIKFTDTVWSMKDSDISHISYLCGDKNKWTYRRTETELIRANQ